MTQKIETWNRSVGWYSFEQQKVSFRRMSMNSGTRPVLVHLEEPVTTTLSAKVEERDAEFYTFIKNTLGKELYSSIQINGEGFDQEWAQKSVKLLCYQRRKVFYGNNLFARGACSAGAERVINHDLKDYRYMSSSLVLSDVGMELRVMGAPAYYPLIESGRNWYETGMKVCRADPGWNEGTCFYCRYNGRGKKETDRNGIAGAAGETRADNETWCESAVYFTG